MQGAFHGNSEIVRDDLKRDGLEYAVSIGRRAPMHRIHLECLQEIADAGLMPVVFIGSTNGADSAWFDPVKNPLTLEQQKDQLKYALPHLYDEGRILTLADVGDQEKWFAGFFAMFDGTPFKDKSVVHYRSKAADAKDANAAIRPLSAYMEGFGKRGLPAWESYNRDPADDNINATEIRSFDLDNLTPDQRALMATPDYIIELARAARDANPDKELLKDIPLTIFDLTLERMWKEAGISTAQVMNAAPSHTLNDLQTTAISLVKNRTIPKDKSMTEKISLKIASASTNQTGGDWPRNLANIIKAVDKAVEEKADILALEELGLSGYERGDDFQYSDNSKTREMLQIIADYAASKNPNLIISVGHPWYFADKDLPTQDDRRKNPLFNRVNKQYDVQSFLTGGEVVAISAKSYLFNYERGYETRHFEEWSDEAANKYENKFGKGRDGTIMIELPGMTYPDGTEVPAKAIPFGSPVIQAGDGERAINLWHIICEMYWIGSRFDGSADNNDYARDNPLAQKSRDFDITVAVNPNASPPVANKIDKHYELSRLASGYAGVLVHTDGLGSSGSTFAQFGSRLMAQDGAIISEGARGTFADMAYTSQIVQVTPAIDKGHAPHATVTHRFSAKHDAPAQDGPAAWEHGPRREMEEELRNELLWLYDYMRKNKIQGVTQALSGGMDSAYNAAKVRMMVELGVSELGFTGFMDSMSHLSYKNEALAAFRRGGREAGIAAIMDNMLTNVYMGTDNSSDKTLNAAKTLVEGGTRADGTSFKGIGGKFEYRNVQRLVEVYAEIYSGVNPGQISDEREAEIRKELAAILRTRKEDVTPEELERRIHVLKSTFEEVTGDVLSVGNDKHAVAYENIQARLRQVLISLFSNVENKMSISNPNLDEGRNSYSTWGGDLHGGMIAGNAHKDKQRQIDHMKLLYEFGLEGGVAPVEAFHWVLANRPSAELQPLGKDGKVTQFDEDQLGRSFRQMDMISHFMLNDRPLNQGERKNSPIEVFEKVKAHPYFEGDSIETVHDRVRLSYDKWAHAQFKIHGSPLAATYGKSIDKQSSLRTPNISAFHKPELAQVAIYALEQAALRDGENFAALSGGASARALIQRAMIDNDFANALSSRMWTPGATDGRKMKLDTLHRYARENTLGGMTKPSKMSQVFDEAARYRKAAAETTRTLAKKHAKPGI